jgi:hypothetical protein
MLNRSHSCECAGCDGCAPHNTRRAVLKCRASFVGVEAKLPAGWSYGMAKSVAGEKFTLLCPVCEPHSIKEPHSTPGSPEA